MTRTAATPGASLHQAKRRLLGRGFGLPRLLSDGVTSASSTRPAVTFTGSATPHTAGSWSQIVAALSEDVGFVRITHTSTTNTSAADSSALFNLGIGGAGSETVILDSLGVGYWTSSVASPHPGWMFPIFIPRGTRVAGQVQGAEASKSIGLRFDFFAPIDGVRPSSTVKAIGADTSTSKGVSLATPGANNTEGAWTQVTAATTEPYAALGVSLQGGADTSTASGDILLDIAAGASGAEVVIIGDLYVASTSAETILDISPAVHPVSVPAGTRLVARYQTSSTLTALDVILHGIRYPS